MAVALLLSIDEISQGADVDVDDRGERKYHRVFRLTYDGPTTGPAKAIIDQLVKRYDVYEEPSGFIDEGALAISATAQAEDPDTSYNWLATVFYSSRWWDEVAQAIQSGGVGTTGPPPSPSSGGSSPEDNSPANPLARPPKYRWGWVSEREVMERDYDPDTIGGTGNPMVHTNGVPFDPPLETERKLLTLTIERNTLNYDPVFALTFYDHVNLYDVTIGERTFSPGTVKCEYWTAESQGPENRITYWAETLQFTIKRGRLIPNDVDGKRAGWLRVTLNAGLQELRGGKLKDIIRQGHPVSIPWPLKLNGEALPEGYATTDLIYRTFVEFPPTDFGPMNLG